MYWLEKWELLYFSSWAVNGCIKKTISLLFLLQFTKLELKKRDRNIAKSVVYEKMIRVGTNTEPWGTPALYMYRKRMNDPLGRVDELFWKDDGSKHFSEYMTQFPWHFYNFPKRSFRTTVALSSFFEVMNLICQNISFTSWNSV